MQFPFAPIPMRVAGLGPRAALPSRTVLVIDDEAESLAAALSQLVAAGFVTVVAADGDGALHRVRTELTQLVVAELYVPCAEGPCVVAALKRERDRLPRLRVLVHTRHVSGADEAWALGAGADALLHKSARPGALVREVERLARLDVAGVGDAYAAGRPA